jgi:hypothetical protein
MDYFDLTFEPSAAYRLAQILAKSHYNNVIVIEFHKFLKKESEYSEKLFEEFCEKSSNYYKTFIHSGVDREAANISLAVKIANEWFVVEDCGSNYYLGFGPSGILSLRKICFERGILMHFKQESFTGWIKNKFGKDFKSIDRNISRRNQFDKIINLFIDFGINVQIYRKTFSTIKEENLRDLLMPIINGITKNKAAAEALSGSGKTDISIRTKKGNNQYIFELKLWSGQNNLDNTIEQLTSYLNWHNEYAGILFFCRVKNLTSIINKARERLYDKYNPVYLEKERHNEIRFEMDYPNDIDKKLLIHINFINLF